jgi:ABC-type uncharacterized transport system permease subunit
VSEERRGPVERRSPALRRWMGNAAGALVFPLIAILISFTIGAIIMLATGNNPIVAFGALFRGAFGSPLAIGRTLLNATPLIFTGLAVAVAFRAGLFNIGGEGQFYIGAITAAVLGVYLATYLALNPFRSEGLVPGTEAIDLAARIPFIGAGLGRANYGFVFGLVAAAVVYLFLWRTKRGFELRAVGLSPGAASYAGMHIGLNTVLALAIGGSLAALGGGEEVLGVYGKMSIPFVQGLGFNGIGVALLGRNHPVGVVFGAILFGGMISGAQEMQFETDVPLQLASVLLAVILLLVTATKLVELIAGKRARAFAGARLEKGLGQ